MKARRFIVSTVVLLAMVLTACSTSNAPVAVNSAYGGVQPTAEQATAASTAVRPAEAAVTVTIQNFAFDPSNLTVKTGTTVTWTNMDGVNHTVTSDTGLFDSGELGKGGTFSFTFDKAGVYTYYCVPHHSKMQGTVTVTD
jgi:plastocyanin